MLACCCARGAIEEMEALKAERDAAEAKSEAKARRKMMAKKASSLSSLSSRRCVNASHVSCN